MRDFVREEGGKPVATIVGEGDKYPARAAALANGTICTHWTMMIRISPISGISPSESILPLWPPERKRTPQPLKYAMPFHGCRGCMSNWLVLGRIHYQRGFHQTATAGAIGATVAAGRLYRLTTN